MPKPYKRKDSSYYWFKYTINGKPHYISLKTTKKREAEEIVAHLIASRESNFLKFRHKTWADLDAELRCSYHVNDQKTLDWFLHRLGPRKLSDLGVQDFYVLMVIRSKQVSRATVNRNFNIARSLLNKAVTELGWIPSAPKIKRLKENEYIPHILTKEEERMLLIVLPQHLKDIVQFALATGLRKSEIVNLTVDMLSDDFNYLSIPSSLMKNKQPHKIPLHDDAQEVLRRLPGQGMYPHLFKYNGKPIKDPAGTAWKNALKKCNLKIRFHDLRHTWATRKAAEGASALQLQKLGGWKSLRMLERYVSLQADDFKNLPGY